MSAPDFPDVQTVISDADTTFHREVLKTVPGWLFEPAAELSAFLVRSLGQTGSGSILEIGVFHGRYLACLHRAAAAQSWQTIGLDTFEWVSQDTVHEHLTRVLGSDHHVSLWAANSQLVTQTMVADRLGDCPLRFASVDGDHRAEAVVADLELVATVLARDGVVAADDFLNPLALGATEGIMAYLLDNKDELVPFSFAGNKLFLCRPDLRVHFQQHVHAFVTGALHLPQLDEARQILEMGEAYFCQYMGTGPCLILSGGVSIGMSRALQ